MTFDEEGEHMDSKFLNDDKEINTILRSLESAKEHLEFSSKLLQDPNLKRKLSQLKLTLASLNQQVEAYELKYRKSQKDKEVRRMLVDDERYRTNYNKNTDGRIIGAYYSGPGDMGKKRS